MLPNCYPEDLCLFTENYCTLACITKNKISLFDFILYKNLIILNHISLVTLERESFGIVFQLYFFFCKLSILIYLITFYSKTFFGSSKVLWGSGDKNGWKFSLLKNVHPVGRERKSTSKQINKILCIIIRFGK